MWVGSFSEVGLPFGCKFPEIMPQSGEVTPLVGGVSVWAGGKHFGGKFSSPVGDFVEVAVLGLHAFTFSAVIALAVSFPGTEGREEGFPGGGVRVGGFSVGEIGGVGVERHGAESKK